METKPYSLQSPEQIAKDYGGNKQKIAEAMQMGIIDPTAGTMAGMFIDRMRSAAQLEAAPQQSVAEQVFAPPQMPAGLGATPQAAAMAPQMPPMGAPAGDMMPAPPMGEMQQPEMGMAAGGLTTLPIPDGMFDEPTNGGFDDGYAGGGLVAFAAGDVVDEDGDGSPDTYFGYNYKDPTANAALQAKLFGTPESKYAKEYEADLLQRRSPEAMKAGRKKDINMALIEAGIAMANTPGSLLQSATRGIGAALPGFKAAEKERRAEEREIQKGLLDLEQGRNTAAAQKAMQLLEMQRTGIQGKESQIGREFQRGEAEATRGFQREQNALDRAVQMFGYSQRGKGDGSGSGSGEGKPPSAAKLELARKAMDNAWTAATLADKDKNPQRTEAKLKEYGAARYAFNKLAALSGLSPVTGYPGKKLINYEDYVKKNPPAKQDKKVVKGGKVLTYNPKTGKLE